MCVYSFDKVTDYLQCVSSLKPPACVCILLTSLVSAQLVTNVNIDHVS